MRGNLSSCIDPGLRLVTSSTYSLGGAPAGAGTGAGAAGATRRAPAAADDEAAMFSVCVCCSALAIRTCDLLYVYVCDWAVMHIIALPCLYMNEWAWCHQLSPGGGSYLVRVSRLAMCTSWCDCIAFAISRLRSRSRVARFEIVDRWGCFSHSSVLPFLLALCFRRKLADVLGRTHSSSPELEFIQIHLFMKFAFCFIGCCISILSSHLRYALAESRLRRNMLQPAVCFCCLVFDLIAWLVCWCSDTV
jgi:hypothetical protein